MNVGWVGLGKLGLPIAEEIAKTHTVYGHDVRDTGSPLQAQGEGVSMLLRGCDLIFVAVQTPHQPEYEGVTRLPVDRADFDYCHLIQAVRHLADGGPERPPLVVVSTVLPGTIERDILPLWDGHVLYNPFFIAMGSEVADFLDPEFVLIGARDSGWKPDNDGVRTLADFYASLHITWGSRGHAPILIRTYREAELAKMAYNTFIGLKIAYANTVGEMSSRLGIDADQVLSVVRRGTRRIVSDFYLSPGMGDGGPCHPRDNIALSWLARETGMSYDLFSAVMEQREAHTEWLADRVQDASHRVPVGDRDGWEQYLPVTILGRSYKPGTRIETGSPAILLSDILDGRGVQHDHVDDLADNGIGWVGDGFDI